MIKINVNFILVYEENLKETCKGEGGIFFKEVDFTDPKPFLTFTDL